METIEQTTTRILDALAPGEWISARRLAGRLALPAYRVAVALLDLMRARRVEVRGGDGEGEVEYQARAVTP